MISELLPLTGMVAAALLAAPQETDCTPDGPRIGLLLAREGMARANTVQLLRRSVLRRLLAAALLSPFVTTIYLPAAPLQASDAVLDRQADIAQAVALVRHFHPHDAVDAVDFNSVLLQGFALAEGKGSDSEFTAALADLLAELGYGIIHREAGQETKHEPPAECDAHDPAVRWVHRGFAAPPIAEPLPMYSSRRSVSGVPQAAPQAGDRFAMVTMALPGQPWRGRTLTLSAQARVQREHGAVLWVQIEGTGLERFVELFSPEWSEYELTFEVEEAAEAIQIGFGTRNEEYAELRSLELVTADLGEKLLSRSAEWQFISPQSSHKLDVKEQDGNQTVSLTPSPPEKAPADIDRFMPEDAPDVASLTLLDGSTLHVPLVLCQSQATADEQVLTELASRFAATDLAPLERQDLARLDVAVLWPVMRHFYPYQELVEDWNALLLQALKQAGMVESRQMHRRLLQRLMAALEDGHVTVRDIHPDYQVDRAWLPIALEPVAESPVVARVAEDSPLRPGDRVTAIHGEDVAEWLAHERANHSGSPHWQTYQALLEIKRGPRDLTRELTVARDGEEITVELAFERGGKLTAFDHPPIKTLGDGIVYINLRVMHHSRVDDVLPQLADARGVIMDLRGNPRADMSELIRRLMTEDDDWDGWMRTLVARSPEGDLVEAEVFGWGWPHLTPSIASPVAFLTNHRAISHSEGLLGLVRRHGLATIVGSETAGSNGNVQVLSLPGMFQVSYTGMRVIGPDGDIFQGRGLKPDHRIDPTVEGLGAGRDEVLDYARCLLSDTADAQAACLESLVGQAPSAL